MTPSNPFFDAFISYGRADSKAFATKLHGRLKEAGYRIWFDQEDIPLAVDFQEQINNGIEKTHNFLFLISPHSANSPYCLKEIELAIALNKRIIPLLHVETIDRELWQSRNPEGTDEAWAAYQAAGRHTCFQNMHPVISKINWIFFREGIDDFDLALAGLTSAIDKHEAYVQRHTEYMGLALEWSRNQRRSRYLLTEEPKRQAAQWLKHRFADEQAPCIPTELHGEYICASMRAADSFFTQTCLCYVHAVGDRIDEVVRSIRRSLLLSGITVADNKIDRQTTKEFTARRRQKIDFADNFIYFVTPESISEDYCRQQFEYARDHHKRIIFVILEPTPGDLYPPNLEQVQIIDFIGADDPTKRQARTDSLLNLLDTDSYYHNRHKYLLAKAISWQEQRQLSSLLLRGKLRQIYTDLRTVSAKRKEQQYIPLQQEFIAASVEAATKDIELDVFLSYADSNLDFVTRLNANLEEQGKLTFFAHLHADLETEETRTIDQALVDCANFIFVISPEAVRSKTYLAQLNQAKVSGKRIVGVICVPTAPESVATVCGEDQLVDFSSGADFYAELSQVVRLLETDKAHLQSHTKWFRRAVEWEQKKKTRDLLLRGNELAIAQYWLKEADDTAKQPKPTPLQREFIQDSIAESRKSIRRQKLLFAAVSVGFVISTILGIFANRKSYEAAVSELGAIINTSKALFSSDNELDAFVEAMGAWQKSQQIRLDGDERHLRRDVSEAISQSVYQLREYNRLHEHQAAVFAVDYNRAGDRLVSGSADRHVNLWSEEGELLQTLGKIGPINKGHTAAVYAVQFSPDDQLIASGSGDRSIKLWQLDPDGQYQFMRTLYGCVFETEVCNGHKGSVNEVAFRNPDGNVFASASEDKTIKLWTKEGEYLATLGEDNPEDQHTRAVNDIAFSKDGQFLVSGSDDRSIKIWERQLGGDDFTLRQTITDAHGNDVKGIAMTPSEDTIVSASDDKTVKIWDLKTGELLHTLKGHDDEVESVAVDSHVRGLNLIASVSRDKTIRIWDTKGTAIRTLSGHKSRIYDVVFQPNASAIASGSRDRTIKLWKLDNDIVTPFYGHTSRVYAVQFSPNNQIVASAGRDRTVRLWSRQGELLKVLGTHDAEIEKVVFSDDGKLVVTASWDGTVKVWKISGELVTTFTGHSEEVYGVDFSPDGTMVASLSADRTMKLWDLDGKELQSININESRVYDLQFSDDGSLIALAVGNTIQTLERQDNGSNTYRIGKKIGGCQILDQNCNAHVDDIEAVAISSNNDILVSGSRDSTVKFWDRNGHHLFTLRGHDSEIEGISLSADDSKLVSASRDSTLVVWENLPNLVEIRRLSIRSDQSLEYTKSDLPAANRGDRQKDLGLRSTVLKGHLAEVYAADFNADGTLLISASADKSIILWNLDVALNLDELIDYGCSWVENYLKYGDEAGTQEQNKTLCQVHNPSAIAGTDPQ